MVIQLPRIRKQLKTLRAISYNMVKNQPAGVVDIPIGQLKPHDTSRALFVVSNAFGNLSIKHKIIMEVFELTVKDIKELITASEGMSKEQVIAEIKRIVIKPDDKDVE